MKNAKKCIKEALDSLNICRENRKIIPKEAQERAIKQLISVHLDQPMVSHKNLSLMW